MLIDADSREILKREINKLVEMNIQGLVQGSFASLPEFERQRGIIVGLGMALTLLEQPTSTETPSEENADEQTAS